RQVDGRFCRTVRRSLVKPRGVCKCAVCRLFKRAQTLRILGRSAGGSALSLGPAILRNRVQNVAFEDHPALLDFRISGVRSNLSISTGLTPSLAGRRRRQLLNTIHAGARIAFYPIALWR